MMKIIMLTAILLFCFTLFCFELVPYRDKQKWGYADPFGTIVIPCQFSSAEQFAEGRAKIAIGDDEGYITLNGAKNISSSLFFNGKSFSDGMAAVQQCNNKKWGFINQSLALQIPYGYQDVGDFHDGLAKVKNDGKTGYIDRNNNVAIPLSFDDGKDFSQGLIAVKKGERWGYIDSKENEIVAFQYAKADNFSEGYAAVSLDNVNSFYIDNKNQRVINQTYLYCGPFSEGVAVVSNGQAYGAININGDVIIPLQYGYLSTFHDGLAGCGLNFKYGYINKSGELVIPLIYNEAQQFYNGYAKVYTKVKQKIIKDSNGNKFTVEEPCDPGFIDVKNKQFWKE